jgi:hypothetical protein
MKKILLFLCAFFFTLFTFTSLPAKAQSLPCGASDPTTGCPVLHSGTNLPINSGLILLLVAGIIIGVAAVKRKTATIGKA